MNVGQSLSPSVTLDVFLPIDSRQAIFNGSLYSIGSTLIASGLMGGSLRCQELLTDPFLGGGGGEPLGTIAALNTYQNLLGRRSAIRRLRPAYFAASLDRCGTVLPR
jgi:hypothetical protein